MHCETPIHQSICHTLHNILTAFTNRFLVGTLWPIKRAIFTARCYVNSVCPSVRPSVTCVLCFKTAERIIEILSRSDKPIILVFGHQGSLHKSDGFTPNGGAKYKGGSDFRPICGYITVRDRGM